MSDERDQPRPDPRRIFPAEEVLYRGTTRSWPGNAELQKQKITCTTTDPFVATLFAIECRNHGQAAVMIASRGPFVVSRVPENWFSLIESAVNVGVSPLEFARRALYDVDVDQAIAVLKCLGFDQLPERLTGKSALQDALEESHRAGHRLSLEQVDEFNRLIDEMTP